MVLTVTITLVTPSGGASVTRTSSRPSGTIEMTGTGVGEGVGRGVGVAVGGTEVEVGCAGTAVATCGRLATVGTVVAVLAAAAGVSVGVGVSSASPPHAASRVIPSRTTTRPRTLSDLNARAPDTPKGGRRGFSYDAPL